MRKQAEAALVVVLEDLCETFGLMCPTKPIHSDGFIETRLQDGEVFVYLRLFYTYLTTMSFDEIRTEVLKQFGAKKCNQR